MMGEVIFDEQGGLQKRFGAPEVRVGANRVHGGVPLPMITSEWHPSVVGTLGTCWVLGAVPGMGGGESRWEYIPEH